MIEITGHNKPEKYTLTFDGYITFVIDFYNEDTGANYWRLFFNNDSFLEVGMCPDNGNIYKISLINTTLESMRRIDQRYILPNNIVDGKPFAKACIWSELNSSSRVKFIDEEIDYFELGVGSDFVKVLMCQQVEDLRFFKNGQVVFGVCNNNCLKEIHITGLSAGDIELVIQSL